MKPISTLRIVSLGSVRTSPWELPVRYAAAYACTLLCIAAAQLYIPTSFALLLAGITILGLPLSLSLRAALARPKPLFHRALINRSVVILTFVASLAFLRLNGPQLFGSSGARMGFFLETARPIALLMEVFLIFAVCRCLAIVHDKDAILCAVPSFSVLLLLIVLHKGPEVVSYFLAWTFVTSLLFALDHRSDARRHVSGVVPAVLPGQDATLSARALVSVMALSLFFASVLSYFLVSREPTQRSSLESAIIQLAARLTGLDEFTDVSVNNGPERQIDFTSGPALPTRAPLWDVHATSPDDRRQFQPQYWRMFTLARYDGHSWAQTSGAGEAVPFGPLTWRAWPLFAPTRMNTLRHSIIPPSVLSERAKRNLAYDIAAHTQGGERAMAQFGAPTIPVRQFVTALETSSGYLPLLPSPRAVKLGNRFARNNAAMIRVRNDRAVDIGVLEKNRSADVISDLPALPEYGASGNGVPTRRGVTPNSMAYLSPAERSLYLQLPSDKSLPKRLREFAARTLRRAAPEENSYRRAQRLAAAIQKRAIYTLRPPAIPLGRDAVDYFLFDSGRGYCTYFASALTVLCRMQGIPARMVSGFTNTEWTMDEQGRFSGRIREANAHSWTEVWVDGWGWAMVDATPADDRGDNAPTVWNDFGTVFGAALGNAWGWIRVRLFLALALMFAVVSFAVLFFGRGGFSALTAWISARLHPPKRGHFGADDDAMRLAVFQVYERAALNLSRHFRRRAPWETPQEWFASGAQILETQSAAPLRILAELYTRASYSLKPMSGDEASTARDALRQIAWRKPKSQPAKSTPEFKHSSLATTTKDST